MAKETLEPVPVTIQNASEIVGSIDSVFREEANIYNLLNGQDYRITLRKIEKNLGTLDGIKKSLDAIKDKKGSSVSSSTSSNQSIDKSELKETLNNILNAIKELKNISVSSPSTSTAQEPPSTSPSKQETQSKSQAESTKKSVDNAKEAIDKLLGEEQKEFDANRKSLANAKEALDGINKSQSAIMGSLGNIGNNFLNLFKDNFRKIFDQWDRQIATLKEQGMGGPNAVALNRITKQTMNAAEETLGWNISIEKAIKATNSMLAAGQNPRYIRENNRQLIMGLEGIGLNLQPNTIRELGNAVFDATHVKELVGGWAQITSADTENRLDKDLLSRYLDSNEFKQMQSVIMRNGQYSRADIELEMQEALKTAIQKGWTNEDAIKIAQAQTQARLGGVQAVVPENISALIGATQLAGTYSGDLKNIATDLSNAVDEMQRNPEARRKILQANAGLAMSNDFTLFNNMVMNDGRTRRMASMEDIEAGQYEGLIPRMMKSVAGHLPAESIGGMSQRLTGDSGFLTTQGFELAGGLLKGGAEAAKIGLLTTIAANTGVGGPVGKMASGLLGNAAGGAGTAGGALGKIGGLLGKAGPIALGVAAVGVTAGLVYSSVEEASQAEEKEKYDRETAQKYYSDLLDLQKQYNEATANGNKELAENIKKQLEETREKTNQQLDAVTEDLDNQSDAWVKAGSTAGGAVIGAAIGTAIAPGIGTAIGGLIGAVGSYFISDTAVKSDLGKPDYEKERSRRQAETLASIKFAEGGIVTEEVNATVGEGNQPEVIIPLTKPERAKELMSQASNMSSANPEVASMMETASKKESIADIIIKAAKSMEGVPYRNGGDSFNHPERGLVCNMLVEYAYNQAGIPIKKGTVNDNVYNNRNDWVFTETPKPGYVIFSNFGERSKYGGTMGYQHMGIMGRGNERIHASSFGKVVINPDYTRGKSSDGTGGVSWELSSRWTKSGKQKPIFAYLKGVDYGEGVSVVESTDNKFIDLGLNEETARSVSQIQAQTPTISVADIAPSEDMIESIKSLEDSPRIKDRLRYESFYSNVSPDVTILSPDIVKDLLYAKRFGTTDDFYDKLANNNPFGLRDIDGSLSEFDSLESGVQAFISKVEKTYDELANMSYMQQINLLKDKHYISSSEHFRATQLESDRLVRSIDNLNASVKESNRIATQQTRLPNMTPIAGRRYT